MFGPTGVEQELIQLIKPFTTNTRAGECLNRLGIVTQRLPVNPGILPVIQNHIGPIIIQSQILEKRPE